MIKKNPNYIDSEFQFDKNKKIGNLRIDLVELSNGVLSFVELKKISDKRLINNKIQKHSDPKIINQMKKYSLFINKYKEDIIDYYEKLIEIKKSLGLTKIENTNLTINKVPKLIIANTYIKKTSDREERISAIEELLKTEKINYEITV